MPNELMKTLTVGANTYDLPQKTSDLTNDSGFITSETDPTVPSWAKASSKPTYTASEVGAATSSHTHGNITNGGDITTNATIASGDRIIINDESASKITNSSITFGSSTTQYLANNGTWQNIPTVPTKTSDLTNDSGFITSESDPIFTASAAHGITSTDITNWNNKISEPASEGTNGQVLMTNGSGTRTWGSVSTADEKVKLTSQSTSGNYPLIFGPTSITSNSTYQGYYNTGITINPNTKTVSATTFVGALTGTASGNLTSSSTLDASKLSGAIPSAVTATTQTSTDNSTKIATTAFVKTAIDNIPTPTETDPVFTGSAAYGISSSDITNWNGKTSNTGTVTSVRVQATSPVTSSVNTAQSNTLDTTIALADSYGDTKNPYASKTKNYVLAAPSNANGVPGFRALVADDIPSLTKSKISDFPSLAIVATSGSYEDLSNKPLTLPAVTTSDNGKVLRVISGSWSAVELPSASGVSF